LIKVRSTHSKREGGDLGVLSKENLSLDFICQYIDFIFKFEYNGGGIFTSLVVRWFEVEDGWEGGRGLERSKGWGAVAAAIGRCKMDGQ